MYSRRQDRTPSAAASWTRTRLHRLHDDHHLNVRERIDRRHVYNEANGNGKQDAVRTRPGRRLAGTTSEQHAAPIRMRRRPSPIGRAVRVRNLPTGVYRIARSLRSASSASRRPTSTSTARWRRTSRSSRQFRQHSTAIFVDDTKATKTAHGRVGFPAGYYGTGLINDGNTDKAIRRRRFTRTSCAGDYQCWRGGRPAPTAATNVPYVITSASGVIPFLEPAEQQRRFARRYLRSGRLIHFRLPADLVGKQICADQQPPARTV